MINQSKPDVGIPETYLNIGGFKLIVGSTFNLIVGALGLAGMTNSTKPFQGFTWGTIPTTWATETDTWQGVSQIIDNTARTVSSITNFNKP